MNYMNMLAGKLRGRGGDGGGLGGLRNLTAPGVGGIRSVVDPLGISSGLGGHRARHPEYVANNVTPQGQRGAFFQAQPAPQGDASAAVMPGSVQMPMDFGAAPTPGWGQPGGGTPVQPQAPSMPGGAPMPVSQRFKPGRPVR